MGKERNGRGRYENDFKPEKGDVRLYQRWRHSCSHKVRFDSPEHANPTPDVQAYLCQFCSKYHLGHPKGTKKQSRLLPVNFPRSNVSLKYVGFKGLPHVLRTVDLAKRTFNFFLLEPGTWNTQDFVNIVWDIAGFNCEEIRLVENSYHHPETKLIAHRYDLYFRVGRGFLRNSEEINVLMARMEIMMRRTLKIQMEDTHTNYAKRQTWLTTLPQNGILKLS